MNNIYRFIKTITNVFLNDVHNKSIREIHTMTFNYTSNIQALLLSSLNSSFKIINLWETLKPLQNK